MKTLNIKDVTDYVENNIGTFHTKRITGLSKLKLKKVLEKKNPYLFKAKSLMNAQDIIKSFTDAFISSQEETIFGDWLEGLALFVNGKVYGGSKSGIEGVDLEFDSDGIRYIVAIKSGPNWGNSSQIAKMRSNFTKAKKVFGTSGGKKMIIAVNGCCYGRDTSSNKGDYFKYCGQSFWEFISGDTQLYNKIIEPLGHKSKEKNEEFLESYYAVINKFTLDFSTNFCYKDGRINWLKLVEFNSGTTRK